MPLLCPYYTPTPQVQNSYIGDRGTSEQSLLISKNWKCPCCQGCIVSASRVITLLPAQRDSTSTTMKLYLLPLEGPVEAAHGLSRVSQRCVTGDTYKQGPEMDKRRREEGGGIVVEPPQHPFRALRT